MTLPNLSPTGKQVVPYVGPRDAKLVLVGESPADTECEQGVPFVGRAGDILNDLVQEAGIVREDCRILNVVPVRPSFNKFAEHEPADLEWGVHQLRAELERCIDDGAKLIMPLGNNPLKYICPTLPEPPTWGESSVEEKGRITAWRGSLFPFNNPMNTVRDYEQACFDWRHSLTYVLPTYHPSAISYQYKWHPWAVIDFKKAKGFLDGKWPWPRQRKWFVNNVAQFKRFVEMVVEREHMVAIDTESSPSWIVACVSEHEVHVFTWSKAFEKPLRTLMTSESVLKVAHNLGHDMSFVRDYLGIEPIRPWVDTGGLGHILDCSLQRNLSPALATRFTTWPYHKWMVGQNPLVYCGYDTIVCYDGYWGALHGIDDERLYEVAEHDHKLFGHLLEMQWKGVRVDWKARKKALKMAECEKLAAVREFQMMAEPIVKEKLRKFEKPHLFYRDVQCECCGGGSVSRSACWRCAGFDAKPKKTELLAYLDAHSIDPNSAKKKAELEALVLRKCVRCNGIGKVEYWFEIKPTDAQVKDILYRGLGIRPRRYKGVETSRAASLEPLSEKYAIVARFIEISRADADIITLKRLEPDLDGRIHATFDPWGTSSGRVASKGGLIQKGTNLMNLEKEHRFVLVPDPGYLMVAPDLSQVEGRNVAVLSGDVGLHRAYTENAPGLDYPDSHVTLMTVLHAREIMLSRDQTKRAAYAAWYGGGAEMIAIELSTDAFNKGEGCPVSTAQAQEILDIIAGLYPGIKTWHDSCIQGVLASRRLVSPTGRRRTWEGYVTTTTIDEPEEPYKKTWLKNDIRHWQVLTDKVKKEAWSYFPQDMGAWVLALGLERLRNEVPKLVTPLIHVHDELVCQIPEGPGATVDEALAAIKDCMTVRMWDMDFPCDVGTPGRNWKEAKGDG